MADYIYTYSKTRFYPLDPRMDDSLLYDEFVELMGMAVIDPPAKRYLEHDLSQRDFTKVESEFLTIFHRLMQGEKGFSSVGVDGCRGGWIAVRVSRDGFEVERYQEIEEICSKYEACDSIFVDMPIGLPETVKDVRPDAEARTYLSGRTSCIFNTPCRQAVYEQDYTEASRINRLYLGKGLSKQSFAISSQIRAIDKFMEKAPRFNGRLRESHPEVCFAVLASRENNYLPLYNSKHTEQGILDRIDVLEEFYENTAEFVAYVTAHPVLKKHLIDCIDALCLAVSGLLGLENGVATIPEQPAKDARGISMEIVYGRKKSH